MSPCSRRRRRARAPAPPSPSIAATDSSRRIYIPAPVGADHPPPRDPAGRARRSPLHRQRELQRGYNQADLVARPLARNLGLPYRAVLLTRTKPRPDKHILSLEERWESVRGAFATRPGSKVDNLRVLLVDDVMTTGATLDAAARALRDAGAKSVIGLTVARAARHPAVGSGESNPRDAQ